MTDNKERHEIVERTKVLEALVQARYVEARNEVEQGWVTSSEMKERLIRRGFARNNCEDKPQLNGDDK